MQWVHISNPPSVLLADPVLSFTLEPQQLQPGLRIRVAPGFNAAQLSASFDPQSGQYAVQPYRS